MKKSEKQLLIALAILFCVFGVFPFIWSRLRDPIAKAESSRDLAQGRLDTLETDQQNGLAQIRKMIAYKERSLSSDPSQAAHAYQTWLSDLTEDVAGFDEPEVTPDRISPSRDKTFVSVRIRVRGEGTLEQLRTFLYRFHRANILHRVDSLTVDALDNTRRPLLKIDITCEALSLKSAPPKPSSSLFPRTELVADAGRGLLEVAQINTFVDTPFEIRIGDKYTNVIEKGKQFWAVEGEVPKLKKGDSLTLVEAKPAADDKPTKDKPADDEVAKTAKTSSAPKTEAEKQAELDAKLKALQNKPKAPQVELVEDVKDGDIRLVVASTTKFPRAPFEVKAGATTLRVTERSEQWILEDQRLEASKGAIVEISPVHPDFADSTLASFDSLIKQNPFSKTLPMRPRLDLIGEKIVKRGSKTILTPRASGYDDRQGKAKIEITSELIEGMVFENGQLKWNPPTDMKAGRFDVVFKASAPALNKPLEQTFSVSLVDANDPPELDVPRNVVAVVGKEVSFQLLARDKETPDDLTFNLGSGAPEGVNVDPKSGFVSWTPPATQLPGTIEIPVTVTDVGTPQQTTSAKVIVELQDDVSQFTYLTAFVATEADRQAWLYDRSTNKRLILREGGTLKYAGFDALVLEIGRETVLLQQGDETWELEVGKSLREARVIARAKPPEPVGESKPTETPADVTTKDTTVPADKSESESSKTDDAATSDAKTDEAEEPKPIEPKSATDSQPSADQKKTPDVNQEPTKDGQADIAEPAQDPPAENPATTPTPTKEAVPASRVTAPQSENK